MWGDDFSSLLSIVKEFIVDVWESRKLRLYGENACPGPQPNSSGWDLGQDGKLWNGRRSWVQIPLKAVQLFSSCLP